MTLDLSDLADLPVLTRLLDETFEKFLQCTEGFGKVGENLVQIYFGDHESRSHGEISTRVVFYSKGRRYQYNSVAEALAAVRRLHAETMAHDCAHGHGPFHEDIS